MSSDTVIQRFESNIYVMLVIIQCQLTLDLLVALGYLR